VLGKSYPPYRYRLTVEIDTPEGLRRGSSVIEVQTARGGALTISGGGGGGVAHHVVGQAVAVDLPNGQTLFALLRSDWGPELAEMIYPRQVPHPTRQEVEARAVDGKWDPDLEFDMWMERVEASHGDFTVPRWRTGLPQKLSGWPMLVHFRDIRDPASVAAVDPDELKATFGRGYAVRRVLVQKTDEPASGDIVTRLPWLARRPCYLASHPIGPDGFFVPMKDVGLAVHLRCIDFLEKSKLR
jgi:hypothetical protein